MSLKQQEDNMYKKELVQDRILKHVIGNKVNQVISFMLSHYNEDLSKEVLDMIKEEIRTVLSRKIKLLLETLFASSQNQWFKLIMVSQPDGDHYE